MNRLDEQIRFLLETDRLKQVLRQTYLLHEDRHENSAEHSWQLAVMVMVLAEHAPPDIDRFKVVRMLLLHDLVEIDAGDTYCYDHEAMQDKLEREGAAASRIFGLLPGDQGNEFSVLWHEFEERSTPEAKFAAALDRMMPILHNYYTQGKSWLEHGITARQVLERNRHMAEGAPKLWEFIERLVQDAEAKGFLRA
jgi:putative hydrolases of HD superfamily